MCRKIFLTKKLLAIRCNRISSCISQGEIPLENVDNNFDFNCTGSTPCASSSYLPPVICEPRSGSLFLTDLLLHNDLSRCGITASFFIASLDTMRKSVSLHGIVVHGLPHEILLRQIFKGDCVQGPNNNDRRYRACRHFAQDFTSLINL